MKNTFYFMMLLVGSMVFAACEKDDPVIPNEEELITTLTYTLTPQAGGDAVVFSFQSLEGNSPVIKNGTLSAHTIYEGEIKLLNEVAAPAEDITVEVEEEGDEHQFFFNSTVPEINVFYADMDVNDKPIGISNILTTEAAGAGKLTIILRHTPNKEAEGVAAGDVTNAGGETDIEVTFDVNVQ